MGGPPVYFWRVLLHLCAVSLFQFQYAAAVWPEDEASMVDRGVLEIRHFSDPCITSPARHILRACTYFVSEHRMHI